MTTLAARTVQESLTVERSVLDYFKDLEDALAIMYREIKNVISVFFTQYSTDGKVPFAITRRRLDAKSLKMLHTMIDQWRKEYPDEEWPEFAKKMDKLYGLKNVTYLEDLLLNVQYSVEKFHVSQRSGFIDLLGVVGLFSFYRRMYDTAVGTSGVPLVQLSHDVLSRIVRAQWNDTKRTANAYQRITEKSTQMVRELEHYIPQAFASGQKFEAMMKYLRDKSIDRSLGRLTAVYRTEATRMSSAADIQFYKEAEISQYRFVAVLDAVTSQICRSLNGAVFNVSEATAQVNLPPMHTYCRSSTEPVLSDQFDGELLSLSRTLSMEDYIVEYVSDEYKDILLEFVKKYYR